MYSSSWIHGSSWPDGARESDGSESSQPPTSPSRKFQSHPALWTGRLIDLFNCGFISVEVLEDVAYEFVHCVTVSLSIPTKKKVQIEMKHPIVKF